jgi:chromosome segregation ATPase
VYIFELASYLVVAILFGIGAGWLIWGDEPFEAAPAGDAPATDQAVADLSSQVETRDQEIVRLRKRLKRMHADMDARDLHLTEVKGHSEELQGLLVQRESELAAALNGEALPDGASETQTRRISELEELVAASRSEADGLARKLQDSLAEAPANPELARRLAELESENADANESRFQLAAAHEELQRSHGAISNDLAEAQARLDELSSGADLAELDRVRVLDAEIARLRNSASAAQERIVELESEHQRVTAALATSENRAISLQSQLAAEPEPNNDTELELAKVHAELARSRQNVNTLRQRLQDVEDENESLAGDLARATTELQGRSAKSGEAATARDQLIAERDQLTAQRDQLTAQRDQLTAARDSAFAERDQTRSDRDAMAQAQHDLQARLDEVERARAELRAATDEAASESEGLKQDLHALRSNLSDVEGRASQADAEVRAARERVSQLEGQVAQGADTAAERQRLEQSLTEMTATHESTVAQLHVELSEARLRADSAFEALHELNDEFINFRDVTMRQQSTMNSLADRLAKANMSLGSRRLRRAMTSDRI